MHTTEKEMTIAQEIEHLHHGVAEQPSKLERIPRVIDQISALRGLGASTARDVVIMSFVSTIRSNDAIFREFTEPERRQMFLQTMDLVRMTYIFEDAPTEKEFQKYMKSVKEEMAALKHSENFLDILDRIYNADPAVVASLFEEMARNYFASDAFADLDPNDRANTFHAFMSFWQMLILMPNEEFIHLYMVPLTPEELEELAE